MPFASAHLSGHSPRPQDLSEHTHVPKEATMLVVVKNAVPAMYSHVSLAVPLL